MFVYVYIYTFHSCRGNLEDGLETLYLAMRFKVKMSLATRIIVTINSLSLIIPHATLHKLRDMLNHKKKLYEGKLLKHTEKYLQCHENCMTIYVFTCYSDELYAEMNAKDCKYQN